MYAGNLVIIYHFFKCYNEITGGCHASAEHVPLRQDNDEPGVTI